MADEKKIIIDEDWKEQAQKEKEKLAEQEQTEDKQHGRGPLPKGDLSAMISMLTTQILFSLGFLQMEGQEPREPDLELAKFNIDLLETLEEKTKGNLTEEEAKLLKNTLNEVRMAYVKMAG